jgi:hypothetical protein
LIFFIVANRGGTTERASDPSEVVDPQQGRKLLAVNADDVQRLVIRPAEGKPVELVRGEGVEWKLAQPVSWAADSFNARNLVESVAGLRSLGRVEKGADRRADFGLEKPRYAIDLVDKDNKTTTLQVGNATALGNNLYVDTGDGKGTSIVIGGELAGRIEKGTQKIFEELRDKRLVTATAADIRQVELTRKGGQKLVLRREGNDWKVVEPAQVSADSGEVASLLSVVTGLRAEEFVAADSPEAGGAMVDQPRLTVWFGKDAPATQPATGPAATPATRPAGTTIAFGQYADVEREKVYVKVAPEPAVLAKVNLSEQQWERLNGASPLALRDRKVLDVDPERVEKVAVSVDRAATTQPTAKPAEKREVVLERRREVLEQGPAAPAVPAPAAPSNPANSTEKEKTSDAGTNAEVEGEAVLAADDAKAPADAKSPAATAPAAAAVPATVPATTPAAATAPATAPAEPLTKWVLASEPKGNADDAKVDSLLQGLHPLRVTKYLESAPTTPPTASYVLKVHTTAYGDQPAKVYEIKLTETGVGADAKVIGQYEGLTFEVDRFLLDRVTGDFTKKKDAPQPAVLPQIPGLN